MVTSVQIQKVVLFNASVLGLQLFKYNIVQHIIAHRDIMLKFMEVQLLKWQHELGLQSYI